MDQRKARPGCNRGAESESEFVQQGHLHLTIARRATPRLSAARAATKTAIVDAAIIGAIDAMRAHIAIRLLDLGAA